METAALIAAVSGAVVGVGGLLLQAVIAWWGRRGPQPGPQLDPAVSELAAAWVAEKQRAEQLKSDLADCLTREQQRRGDA